MVNSFAASVNDNRIFFSVFMLNSLAGYLAVYLNFWYALAVFLLSDFILLSLLGGLKEKIGGGFPGLIKMAGYGRRYYFKGFAARIITLIFAVIFVFFLFNFLGGSMDAFYMALFAALSLVGFFLIYIFSSFIYLDLGIFESIPAAFRIFKMQKSFSLTFLIAIALLSFASVNWPYKYLCLAIFIIVSTCSWFVYIQTFQFLNGMESEEI